jgi:capsid protein
MQNFDPSALSEDILPTTATVLARRTDGDRPKIVGEQENRRLLRQRFPAEIKARFDTQFTTDDNRRHWALSDGMSIDAQASWMVRRILRMRCRYEYHNNPYFSGAANRLARFVIGPTGPRLHVALGNGLAAKKLGRQIENSFSAWSKQIRLARKLRTSRASRFYNGEGFLLLRTNPNVRHRVKLDVFEVECDQVSSPLFGMYPANYPDQFFDGVVLDPWGNPEVYHILRQHPGAFGAFVIMGYEFEQWPAKYVIHDYGALRPGQQRGIGEAVPALDLYADLRRFRKAVCKAAEAAARFPMAVKTQGPADINSDQSQWNKPDTYEVGDVQLTVLPDGTDLAGVKAEQPTTTHDAFSMSLLTEIGQVIDMPLFILSGDARLANMASAYIASEPFVNFVSTDRAENYELHCDRILGEFIPEAILCGELPRDTPQEFEHTWRWSRVRNHADPAKMAAAQAQRLDSGTTSIPHEAALDGNDWEEMQESDAKSLGMTIVEYRAALRQKRFAIRGQPSPATVDPEPADPKDGPGDPIDDNENE